MGSPFFIGGNDMRVIAIDYDGTASDHPKKVNALYDNQANFIVINTARPEYLREETKKELKELGIKYHALNMEKIRADIYIDDKNCGGLRWPKIVKPKYSSSQEDSTATSSKE